MRRECEAVGPRTQTGADRVSCNKEGETADARDTGGPEEDTQAPWAQEKLAKGTRGLVLLFLKKKEAFSAEAGEAWSGTITEDCRPGFADGDGI